MANSLITRCPKCSTAFRVSDEALSMAKGKVRCGQCFNIFDASKFEDEKEATNKLKTENRSTPTKTTKVDPTQPVSEKAAKPDNSHDAKVTEKRSTQNQDTNNPDWLNSLFDDKDLHPLEEKQSKLRDEETHHKAKNHSYQNTTQNQSGTIRKTSRTEQENEPAPWEVELAEVEAALKTVSTKPTTNKTSTNTKPKPTPAKDPDYMIALQSLAQSASEQTRSSEIENQHSILDQLSAQESLAPLLEEHTSFIEQKSPHPWLWFLGILLGLALLTSQIAIHFFDEGSRSANFRSVYKTICSYYNCVLPKFEDVSTITIQHVRIQSHPSIKNTLLVNAIITNVSGFSQSMPKIALEFFDLNGSPVAARLFSPADYLHKDFLDITYMPPNTPIHLVIPIQDPGARAVTHQLKAFPSDTRSY